MKTALLFLITLLATASTYGLCTWTEQYCTTDATNTVTCYTQGNAGCDKRSCSFEQKPGGKITIFDDENTITATGTYDMSKEAGENCAQTYKSE